jgi:transcriptional regulator with XRE-family HTH domain
LGCISLTGKLAEKARFSAKWLKAHRARIKLSADQYARLVGVTGLTIYNWERGKGKPSKAKLPALFAVRGIGRRDALKRLELIGPAKKPVAKEEDQEGGGEVWPAEVIGEQHGPFRRHAPHPTLR